MIFSGYLPLFAFRAVTRFEDNSIDFVYVDARHDYKGVLEDLRLYWPKVRQGGILAGHDYLNQVICLAGRATLPG